MGGKRVPLGRRQLASETAKLVVSVVAVAAAVALVLLLTGLRRGIAEQVTLYVDRQAPVLVGQEGMRNFLSQKSVLPEQVEAALARVPGVASAAPISQQYAMLRLHGRRAISLLVGYDAEGGPWRLAAGREPARRNEIALDRVLAGDHGLTVGSLLRYRGARLRVVGLTAGTAGFMTPLAFATRETVNALSRQPGTATFFLVRPAAGVTPAELARRIDRAVPGVAARTRAEVARNDRRLILDAFSAPLLAMVAIAFAVAILVTGLTVYSSTTERRREYATLKALGLSPARLLGLAAGQAAAIALAGTLAGVLLALAAVRGVAWLAPRYLVAIGPATVALVAAGALAIALAAAFLPTRYLVRLDPASAFRR